MSEKLKRQNGWTTDYNVRHRFSSPQRVTDAMHQAAYLGPTIRTLKQQVGWELGTIIQKSINATISYHNWHICWETDYIILDKVEIYIYSI